MRHFALGSILLLGSAQLTLAAIIEVVVGGPGVLKFNPPSVNAVLGDTVRFVFQQKNHTVTQSTLANPCSPLTGGFDSKFMPVRDDQKTAFPTAELNVTKTTPIWAYCRQGTHCNSGMVFALNPANASQLAAFQSAATSPPSVSSTSGPAPVPTSSGVPSSNDHRIIVGGTGVLAFNPPNITAQVGDTLTFVFHQKNHTVTASSFDQPCTEAGFDSGFQPVADGTTNFPTYVVQVNDTKPIWAFCKQGNHCSQGMVFAANAVESSPKNFSAFQDNAKGSSASGSSGYGTTSSAWRPTVGSSEVAVVLCLFAAALLL